MAALNTISAANPTLADHIGRMTPEGGIDTIVELLSMTNEVLMDMTVIAGNLPTGHRTTIRTGLGTAIWRKLYQGVPQSKSTVTQVTDQSGSLEGYTQVDKALAELNGNEAAFRYSEDSAQFEVFSQEMARSVFFGDEGVNSATFTGLAPRYMYTSNTAQSNPPANSFNVISHSDLLGFKMNGTGKSAAVGSATPESMWLVVWGPNTCHGFYPKGSMLGIQVTDKGQVTSENGDGGGMFEVYRTHFKWSMGFTVRDWRYVVRVCNIDVKVAPKATNNSSINITDDTAARDNARKALIQAMISAEERIPSMNAGRAVWYCSRTIREALRFGILAGIPYSLTEETIAGRRIVQFNGIPVVRTDVLSVANEAAQTLPYTPGAVGPVGSLD